MTGNRRREKLVVIGNGPSLRGFDLRSLHGVDSLGMNAAYRHWDRIGWYPDIYCCLDDELINTHWIEIKRLISAGLVRQAFLSGHFLNHVPEAVHNHKYHFLDNFVENLHRIRGRAFGLEFVLDRAFASSDPGKLTTGSYAVRYGISCGYRHIALMGIDLKYVEQLPEARSMGGIKLEMAVTPSHNPNYFFDDYQRKGDTFQVPNPDSHHGDLHLASFEILRNDAVKFNFDVDIVNTSLNSALHEHAVLPYQSIESFLSLPLLGAVIVPTNAKERDSILSNLWLWDQPAFAPFLHLQNREQPKLVLYFNNETGKRLESEIQRAFDNARYLKKHFTGIEFRYLSLYGDDDVYVRDGSKAGPNNQFMEIMKSAADLGKYILYMEADCVPIRIDWLGQLQDLVRHSEPFWVLGSIYRGKSAIERTVSRHINGNAVYAVGDSGFQDFVKSVWQPALKEIVARDSQLAYDMVLDTIFARARSTDPNDRVWHLMQSVAHKFRYTDFIRNYSGRMDQQPCEPNIVKTVLRESPTTHLLHGQVFAAAVRKLREADRVTSGESSFHSEKTSQDDLTSFSAEAIDDGDCRDKVVENEYSDSSGSQPTMAFTTPVEEFLDRYNKDRDTYLQLVHTIHDYVDLHLPQDTTLTVVSKGDNDLLRMGNRRVWHFPRAEDGSYAGYYPASDVTALEHLEQQRSMGAEFLVLPRTAFWWLKHYNEFGRHLLANFRVQILPEKSALIFVLTDRTVDPDAQLEASREIEDGASTDVLPSGKLFRLQVENLLRGFGREEVPNAALIQYQDEKKCK